MTGVLSVVPLDVIRDGFLSSVTRSKHRFALLYEYAFSVVATDCRRGRLSGVVGQEGYEMVSIVGCRKEADDLEWKGMVFVGGLKQPSFSSTPSDSGSISTRGRSVAITGEMRVVEHPIRSVSSDRYESSFLPLFSYCYLGRSEIFDDKKRGWSS